MLGNGYYTTGETISVKYWGKVYFFFFFTSSHINQSTAFLNRFRRKDSLQPQFRATPYQYNITTVYTVGHNAESHITKIFLYILVYRNQIPKNVFLLPPCKKKIELKIELGADRQCGGIRGIRVHISPMWPACVYVYFSMKSLRSCDMERGGVSQVNRSPTM
jgi:hypothetical protein